MSSLLVLGGARSGKSRYAEMRATAWSLRRVYIATAQALDEEMQARIASHQAGRGRDWETIEAPLDLPATIDAVSRPDSVLLVDCLTLWTTNLILADRNCAEACSALILALQRSQGPVILVANEVGLGIVPDNALARRFRDEAGLINQRVAAQAREVQFIAAGLPLQFK